MDRIFELYYQRYPVRFQFQYPDILPDIRYDNEAGYPANFIFGQSTKNKAKKKTIIHIFLFFIVIKRGRGN